MSTKDPKALIRVDPRLAKGLKWASALRDRPAYDLTEQILWAWLEKNTPDLASKARRWIPPNLTILDAAPSAHVHIRHEPLWASLDADADADGQQFAPLRARSPAPQRP